MEFLYLLEKIRMPWLNWLMLLITRFGEETAFLVAAIVVFWCVDKRRGYYMMGVGLLGTLASQFLKLLCRVPRPWVRDEKFTILEEAREAADGYSFPSGHSQSAVGTFGALAYTTGNKWLKWACIAIAVLVPFSRMYIGVHTPADVLVGAGLSLALIFLMRPLFFGKDGKYIPMVLLAMTLCAAAYLCYVEALPSRQDIDPHNLESGLKNAYTLIGCTVGLVVVYYADEKKLHFSERAVWWAQILKAVLGLGLVLLVKEGLRSPLESAFGDVLIARAVRYFLIVLAAGILWPLTFRWFGAMGKKEKTV